MAYMEFGPFMFCKIVHFHFTCHLAIAKFTTVVPAQFRSFIRHIRFGDEDENEPIYFEEVKSAWLSKLTDLKKITFVATSISDDLQEDIHQSILHAFGKEAKGIEVVWMIP